MSELSVKEEFESVFGWKVKDGKPIQPDPKLPKFVIERIKWILPELGNGLTFLGALEVIFPFDEVETRKEWEFGTTSDWLPVTEEFNQWWHTNMLAQQRVAVELLYGHKALDALKAEVKEHESES